MVKGYATIDELRADHEAIEDYMDQLHLVELDAMRYNIMLRRSQRGKIDLDLEQHEELQKTNAELANKDHQLIILSRTVMMFKFIETMDELDIAQRVEWKEVAPAVHNSMTELRNYTENNAMLFSAVVQTIEPESIISLCDEVDQHLKEFNLDLS